MCKNEKRNFEKTDSENYETVKKFQSSCQYDSGVSSSGAGREKV